MAGVFISYRREDSPGHAGRLFDRVRARFGARTVFMDVTAIDAGVDFVDAIERAVGACDVLLAVIGPQWSSAADHVGRRRLDSPTDFVRVEIGGALKRNVRVVPVLVDGARLPSPSELPDDLQPLLRRNAVELRDPRWDADVEQLLSALEPIVKDTDGPLRLEAPPRGRWARTFAAIAAVAAAVVAAALLGPKACTPRSDSAATTTPAVTPTTTPTLSTTVPPAATTPAAPEAAKPPVAAAVPNVVGRSLSDAREILRRAGVDVARVLYRDDSTKAVDLVVSQSNVRTSAGSPPSLALTAVARAALVIRHRPEDAESVRGLTGALLASPAGAGLAIRTVQTTVIRPEMASRVTYGEAGMAAAAADVAKDANAWLRQAMPDRTLLTVERNQAVVPRTIVIGLPDRADATPSTTGAAPLPDVRGLALGEARRRLSASGRVTLDYKWLEDRTRTALTVVSQTELPASSPGSRSVVLDVVFRGTLFVDYEQRDRASAVRLASLLRGEVGEGVVVRPRGVDAVREETRGKVVVSEQALAGEGAGIARVAAEWLAKESGRTTRLPVVTARLFAPRTIVFGFPPSP
jgi:hypothetical protein